MLLICIQSSLNSIRNHRNDGMPTITDTEKKAKVEWEIEIHADGIIWRVLSWIDCHRPRNIGWIYALAYK